MLAGLAEAGEDPESIYKFLDTAGSKLDYRRYGEALFDVLIAGGLLGINEHITSQSQLLSIKFSLAPGGTIVQDGVGKSCRTETCLFCGPDTIEHIKGWEQV